MATPVRRQKVETSRWWEDDDSTVHSSIFETVKAIDKQQSGRRRRYARYLGMYENRDIKSLDGADWAKHQGDIDDEDSKENVVKGAVDAAVAKISTNRPRPVCLTNAGDHKLQAKAKKRTLLIEGVIHDQKAYRKGRRIFRDGCIWDNGILKIYPDYDRKLVAIDRVLDDELYVDDQDGKYGNPRSLIHGRTVTRDEVRAMFPEKECQYAIDHAELHRQASGTGAAAEDPVTLFEAIHLPSGPDAGDGKRVMCTTAGKLLTEEWKRERFPWVPWRWKERALGYRGMGMIEDVESQQKQVTFLDRRIGRILNSCMVRVFLESASGVNLVDLGNDDTGGFLACEYKGQAPIFSKDPGPSPELFAERTEKKASIFESLGISQLRAQSKKPAGLSSGVALREYKDTESERFQDIGQDWEDFWIEVAERITDAAEDLAAHPDIKGITIRVPRGKGIEEVSFSEVDYVRDRYLWQIRPASLLPREPAGRLQTVQELLGIYPQAAPLLASKIDHPDVDDVMSMMTASVDAIRYDIERLEEGTFVTPEPFLDLQTAKILVLAAWLRARNNNAPEKVLSAFENYQLSIDNMLKKVQAEAAAAAMAQGMPGAPGGPGPAPAPGPMPPTMA